MFEGKAVIYCPFHEYSEVTIMLKDTPNNLDWVNLKQQFNLNPRKYCKKCQKEVKS
jgi:hypothetical protein